MNKENTREKEWIDLMNKYDDFFYADDGLFIAYLIDNELEQYYWDFDKIKGLIQSLKNYELKYGQLTDKEKNNLYEKKEILLNMETMTNGIDEYYKRMEDIYKFIDTY